MERGDGWTCLYEGYASKPRPVFIVQDNAVSGQFGSTVMCLITSLCQTIFRRASESSRALQTDFSRQAGLRRKRSWLCLSMH